MFNLQVAQYIKKKKYWYYYGFSLNSKSNIALKHERKVDKHEFAA